MRVLWLTPVLGLLACQADPAAPEACTPEQHCRLLDGEPQCEEGYVWADPDDDSDLTCVEADCQAETTAQLCAQGGFDCGSHAVEDRCGATRTVNCGQCEAGACDGACQDNVYDACTCGAADPCGWKNDGFCDAQCATSFPASHFADDADCGTCASTDNGVCDEPEGTDTCPDDSDEDDCNCPPYAEVTPSGQCACSAGASLVGDACVPKSCDLDVACPADSECSWSFALDELVCSAEEGLLSGGMSCQASDSATSYDRCGPHMICKWDTCDGTPACHRLCKTAEDCDGYFRCGLGAAVCQAIAGSDYGLCH